MWTMGSTGATSAPRRPARPRSRAPRLTPAPTRPALTHCRTAPARKRLAVPFRAAHVPSERSEYTHPGDQGGKGELQRAPLPLARHPPSLPPPVPPRLCHHPHLARLLPRRPERRRAHGGVPRAAAAGAERAEGALRRVASAGARRARGAGCSGEARHDQRHADGALLAALPHQHGSLRLLADVLRLPPRDSHLPPAHGGWGWSAAHSSTVPACVNDCSSVASLLRRAQPPGTWQTRRAGDWWAFLEPTTHTGCCPRW